jgi:hypothetical protein
MCQMGHSREMVGALLTSSEICNVCKDVQYGDNEQRYERVVADRSDRILQHHILDYPHVLASWTPTFTSLTTLNAFSYPAYEKIIFTSALVTPYGVVLEDSKAFWKFADGFFTEVLPPRTTRPVIAMLKELGTGKGSSRTYNISVNNLTIPIPLDNQYEYFVLNKRTRVISTNHCCQAREHLRITATLYPAMATPFNSQSVGKWPLIRNKYLARTFLPLVNVPKSNDSELTNCITTAERQ